MSNNPHTVPKGGFVGTGNKASVYNAVTSPHHNVATASASEYVLGQKIRYYNSTLKGWGTCIYLQYSAGAATMVAGSPVMVDEALDSLYTVTEEYLTMAIGGPAAIALTTMTTLYYGWFWCGGVCPDFSTNGTTDFSAVTVPVATDLIAGQNFQAGTDDLNIDLGTSDATISAMGWSLAADAGPTDMANLVLYDLWS